MTIHLHPLLLRILSSLLGLAQIRQRCFFFSLSRLSVGEVKKKEAEQGRRKKTSGATGNKNSRPGLSYDNMLLLDSITASNSQVLLSNFLSLSIYRSFSSPLSPITPPLCLSRLPPASALDSSYLASCCS